MCVCNPQATGGIMNQQDQQFWEQCAIAAMTGLIGDTVQMQNEIAESAFEQADRMLTERNKRLEGMKPKEAEWIEWKGGDIPVSKTILVEVRFRDQSLDTGSFAGCFEWDHVGNGYDIIAYRVVEE